MFNNVPETNLSTSNDQSEAANSKNPDETLSELGLKWEKGIAKLPGSSFKV